MGIFNAAWAAHQEVEDMIAERRERGELQNECPHSVDGVSSIVVHSPLNEYSSSHCELCGKWWSGNQDDGDYSDTVVGESEDNEIPF